MKIMGRYSADYDTVEANVVDQGAHERFIDGMLPALWDAAIDYGIDPVGMVAQSAWETAWGKFTGVLKPWFYNTAGIKVAKITEVRNMLAVMLNLQPTQVSPDHPLLHAQFNGWVQGARAHAQHLRAYVGIPVGDTIVDPRYTSVTHVITDWAQLGGPGSWAPNPAYGAGVENVMARLIKPLEEW